MADLPDEMLVAYMDGELDPRERSDMTARLAASAELRERLAMFAATGRGIAASFEQPMREPVPEALLRAVRDTASTAASSRPHEAGALARLARMLRALVPEAPAPRLALASVAGLAVGLAGALSLRAVDGSGPSHGAGPSAGLMAVEGQAIVATGDLRRSLESATSAASVPAGGSGTMVRPRLTFKSRDGGFCRQYEVAESATAGHAGIGCRDQAGVWRIRVHMPVALKAGAETRTITASGADTPIAAIVEQLVEGDALGLDEETEVIRRNWRR